VAADDAKSLPDAVDSADVIIWRTALAKGHSSPCVCGDAIYLTTFDDGKLFTLALDRATGKIRWSQQAPNDRIESYHPTGSPAVSTPACAGARVYSVFGSYGPVSYDPTGQFSMAAPVEA